MKIQEWTKTKPCQPGWYWMRRLSNGGEHVISIERLRIYAGKICILNWEISNNAEWSGPIPEPRESNN